MKKFSLVFALAALAPATAAIAMPSAESAQTTDAVTPVVGKMLYSAGGKSLGAVYRLDAAGAPQLLLNGKIVTIPLATLTDNSGRTETSLTKKDLLTAR